MINRYNRSQTLKAVLLIIGGFLSCCLAYWFFRYIPAFVADRCGHGLSTNVCISIGIIGLAATWISGYKTWKEKGGLYSYHQSGLYHDLEEDTPGAWMVGLHTHRITGPAYILGQLFMAGPLSILRARTLLASRIDASPALEANLVSTLHILRTAGKWQGLQEHPGLRDEILYLARMELIDFSDHKGTPRFKAR